MRKSVLLIDDEPAIVTALRVRLDAEGFDVRCANDGRQGLAAFNTDPPDLVILDIGLPDLNGFEVCRRMKASDALSQIPVVFLSANVKDVSRQEAFAAGGAAFLPKPYKAEDLVEAVVTLSCESET